MSLFKRRLVSLLLLLVSCGVRPEAATRKFSRLATAEEKTFFQNSLPRREFSDESKSECLLPPPQPPYSLKLCAHSYYDASNTMAEISVFRGSDSRPFLSSQIDLKGYASSDRNIAADLEGDTLYIAWVSGNPDKNIPSAVNLRILNLTGKQAFSVSQHRRHLGLIGLSG